MGVRYSILPHNWLQSVSMETAWLTDVNPSALTLTEERRALWSRPRRTLTVRWNAVDRDEAHRLFFGLLARAGYQDRLYVPLYQDLSSTTATSSALTIHCPTTDRRFFAGQAVVIYEVVGGRARNVQFGIVDTVNPTNLVLGATLVDDSFVGSGLTGTYPPGSIVCPVFEAQQLLEAFGQALTDRFAALPMTFLEIGDSKIPAAASWGDLSGFPVTGYAVGVNDYFLFDVEPNWAKDVGVGMRRSGNELDLGRAHVVLPRGDQPQFRFRWTCDHVARADAFRVLEFFDAHRGMLVPFFVANPLVLFEVQNLGEGFIDVTRSGDLDDVAMFIQFVYLELVDGSVHIRQCREVTDHDGLNRLELDEDLPDVFLAADVRRCTTAHLVRFESDALREEWLTDRVGSIDIEVVEVLNEREVSLT